MISPTWAQELRWGLRSDLFLFVNIITLKKKNIPAFHDSFALFFSMIQGLNWTSGRTTQDLIFLFDAQLTRFLCHLLAKIGHYLHNCGREALLSPWMPGGSVPPHPEG